VPLSGKLFGLGAKLWKIQQNRLERIKSVRTVLAWLSHMSVSSDARSQDYSLTFFDFGFCLSCVFDLDA